MLYDIVYDDNNNIIRVRKRRRSQPKLEGSITVNRIPRSHAKIKNNEIIPREKLRSMIHIPTIQDNEITVIREHKSIGDSITILSGIQELHNRGIKVYYQAHDNSYELFLNHPALELQKLGSEINTRTVVNLSRPCPAGEYESANPNPEFSRHIIFAIAIGSFKPVIPRLYLTEQERAWGREFVKTTNNVGVVLRSAEIWKDYPYNHELIQLLQDKYQVYIYDKSIKIDNCINVVGYSLREVMAILIYMDCVVTPDTGIMHMCEALDAPCVALFGSMQTQRYLNRGFDSSITFLQGKCIHDKEPCMYQRCKGKGEYQPCMEFKPEYILEKVEEKIYGYSERW